MSNTRPALLRKLQHLLYAIQALISSKKDSGLTAEVIQLDKIWKSTHTYFTCLESFPLREDEVPPFSILGSPVKQCPTAIMVATKHRENPDYDRFFDYFEQIVPLARAFYDAYELFLKLKFDELLSELKIDISYPLHELFWFRIHDKEIPIEQKPDSIYLRREDKDNFFCKVENGNSIKITELKPGNKPYLILDCLYDDNVKSQSASVNELREAANPKSKGIKTDNEKAKYVASLIFIINSILSKYFDDKHCIKCEGNGYRLTLRTRD